VGVWGKWGVVKGERGVHVVSGKNHHVDCWFIETLPVFSLGVFHSLIQAPWGKSLVATLSLSLSCTACYKHIMNSTKVQNPWRYGGAHSA